MFYKLWGLEERLLVTSPPPPSKTSRGGGMPIKSFDTLENLLQFSDYPKVSSDTSTPSPGHGGGMEPLEWMKLLHRQELIHQMEMEKWHDLIGAATELLRQVSFCTPCIFFVTTIVTSCYVIFSFLHFRPSILCQTYKRAFILWPCRK